MEKKYCIYCGKEHDISETICCQCSKKLDPEENLLKDYLLAKTKDKLKGTVEDNLFELIKNFLLSHLYGVIVTISVVFVTMSSVSVVHVPQPQNVDTPPSNDPVVEERDEITEEEKALQDFVQDYSFCFDSDFDLNPHLATQAKSFELPASYGYDGSFEMFDIQYTEDTSITYGGLFEIVEIDPDEPATKLGRQLVSDGIRIAECTIKKNENHLDENGNSYIAAAVHYHITLACMDGQWFIAEAVETYRKGEWTQ